MRQIVKGLLLRDTQVLMVRRSPHRQNYPNSWSFPGGHVEPGETRQAALARELREEIGVTAPRAIHLTDMLDQGEKVTFSLYLVTDWIGTPRNLGDEHDALRWFDLHDAAVLPDLTFDAYRDVFKRLANPR